MRFRQVLCPFWLETPWPFEGSGAIPNPPIRFARCQAASILVLRSIGASFSILRKYSIKDLKKCLVLPPGEPAKSRELRDIRQGRMTIEVLFVVKRKYQIIFNRAFEARKTPKNTRGSANSRHEFPALTIFVLTMAAP